MQGEEENSVARKFREFLDSLGIDPLHFATLFFVTLVIIYIKDLKNWDKLEGHQKAWVGAVYYSSVILIIISLLRLTGVIDL